MSTWFDEPPSAGARRILHHASPPRRSIAFSASQELPQAVSFSTMTQQRTRFRSDGLASRIWEMRGASCIKRHLPHSTWSYGGQEGSKEGNWVRGILGAAWIHCPWKGLSPPCWHEDLSPASALHRICRGDAVGSARGKHIVNILMYACDD